MKNEVREGGVRLLAPKGVFYNPEMELCRSMGSLAFGAIGKKMSLADVMCATGVRGLRYALENKNAGKLTLSDLNDAAILCAKKNALRNKVKCRVKKAEANALLSKSKFDFVEIDPFGSPQPYLYQSARSLGANTGGYLSITATDMAVLCGAHHAACLKNYCAIPLDNEFCHENAARILAGAVARHFAPLNLSAKPIFTLSHRHYLKMIFIVEVGAEEAVLEMKKQGSLSYCPSCLWREAKRFAVKENCPHCNHVLDIAGPFYLGGLWDSELLERMIALNAERNYAKKKEIEKLLTCMLSESRIASYAYYDLHTLAKKTRKPIAAIDTAIERLKQGGFAASRTHFSPTSIKTDCPHGKLVKVILGE